MDIPQRGSEHARVNWCFTINNPRGTKEQLMEHLKQHCKGVVVGDEIGESGTPHFQGFLSLEKKLRFQHVLAIFPKDEQAPHVEPAKTWRQAIEYCQKDGKYCSFGLKHSKQGDRSDLKDQCDMIIDGAMMRDVALHSPATFVRNYRGLQVLQDLLEEPRLFRRDLEVDLYYGKTGTGKSYKAYLDHPDLYKKPVGKGLWFDGLKTFHKVVLLEEVTGQYPLEHLLQILDIYPCRVEVKGGHAFINADKIIITTNIHPGTWYNRYEGREEQGLALCRRFTKILWFRAQDDVREIGDRRRFWEDDSEYQ